VDCKKWQRGIHKFLPHLRLDCCSGFEPPASPGQGRWCVTVHGRTQVRPRVTKHDLEAGANVPHTCSRQDVQRGVAVEVGGAETATSVQQSLQHIPQSFQHAHKA
jgi:hypothetical protein